MASAQRADDLPEPERYPGSRLGRPLEGPGSIGSFGRRFLGIVVDWGVALLIAHLLFAGRTDAMRGRGALVPVLVLGLMHWLLVGTVGATIGHRLAGLRVEPLDGGPVGPARALVRAVLLCLGVPPLTLLADADQRGLHDRVAGTLVARR